jgi:hypothetical protein
MNSHVTAHVEVTALAIRSTRSIAKMLPKQATATTSPPIPHDFATCSFLRSSNLLGSPSTT